MENLAAQRHELVVRLPLVFLDLAERGPQLLRLPLQALLPERYRHDHREFLREVLAEPRARTMGEGQELFALRRDGHEFPVDLSILSAARSFRALDTGERWGGDWERQRDGWDRWDHRAAPAPAVSPVREQVSKLMMAEKYSEALPLIPRV